MYLVVFRNRKRADIDADAYARDAEAMADLAREQPGFISFKSYVAEDGEVVALSEWADAQSARAWGEHPDHARVQAAGRDAYYEDYTSFACDSPRVSSYRRTM